MGLEGLAELLGVRRLLHEAYDYNPATDMLTSDQWDEVTIKDHWYRERALDFLAACQHGGTVEGIARAVAATVPRSASSRRILRRCTSM